jgi:hypothetical protein
MSIEEGPWRAFSLPRSSPKPGKTGQLSLTREYLPPKSTALGDKRRTPPSVFARPLSVRVVARPAFWPATSRHPNVVIERAVASLTELAPPRVPNPALSTEPLAERHQAVRFSDHAGSFRNRVVFDRCSTGPPRAILGCRGTSRNARKPLNHVHPGMSRDGAPS